MPSRRELLFGFLGLGVGVAGTYAYYNAPLDQATVDEKLTALLDDFFEDEAAFNLLDEEIENRRMLAETYVSKIDELVRQLDQEEADIDRQIEQVRAEAAAAAPAGGK